MAKKHLEDVQMGFLSITKSLAAQRQAQEKERLDCLHRQSLTPYVHKLRTLVGGGKYAESMAEKYPRFRPIWDRDVTTSTTEHDTSSLTMVRYSSKTNLKLDSREKEINNG